MNESSRSLAELIQEIEQLCVENEVSQLFLQENWPPSATVSASAVLAQCCKDSLAEFRARMQISDTKLLSMSLAPEHIAATLETLTQAIRSTRQEIRDRLERLRNTQ